MQPLIIYCFLALQAFNSEESTSILINAYWEGTCTVRQFGKSGEMLEVRNQHYSDLGRVISVEANADDTVSVVSSGGWLQILDAHSPSKELLRLKIPGLTAVSQSGDSSLAVAIRLNNENSVHILSGETGRVKIVLGKEFEKAYLLSLSWSPCGRYLAVSSNQEESLNNGPRAALILNTKGDEVAKISASNLVFVDDSQLIGNPNPECTLYHFDGANLKQKKRLKILGVSMNANPDHTGLVLFRCTRRFGEGDLFEPFNVARLYNVFTCDELSTIRFRGRPKFVIRKPESVENESSLRRGYWKRKSSILTDIFIAN